MIKLFMIFLLIYDQAQHHIEVGQMDIIIFNKYVFVDCQVI
jgi:hypothetical protein